MDAPKPVYENLLFLVKDKDYFVLTTNVDHCFQRSGFDKERMFYTQGDYGLWQCSRPCRQETWDNKELTEIMLEDQGWEIAEDGSLSVPEGTVLKMKISSDLVPKCPHCGRRMTMNLRSDNRFVEDEGWHRHAALYEAYLEQHIGKKMLYLELGVGMNTPGIIKYPFWQMTYQQPEATYVCLNYGQAYAPEEIQDRSICINGDIGEILDRLTGGADEIQKL